MELLGRLLQTFGVLTLGVGGAVVANQPGKPVPAGFCHQPAIEITEGRPQGSRPGRQTLREITVSSAGCPGQLLASSAQPEVSIRVSCTDQLVVLRSEPSVVCPRLEAGTAHLEVAVQGPGAAAITWLFEQRSS